MIGMAAGKEIKVPEVPTHLQGIYNRSTTGKCQTDCRLVASLLVKYQDTFSKDDNDLGLTHLTEHEIPTGDARPIKQPPRRVPHAFANEEKKAVEELKKKGVIRESTSPWASPIVLVRKKNGKVRPCVDYRRLNKLVQPPASPLPRIQDCLDAVAGSSMFSSLDLTSGYFQIPVKAEDIPKTAFATKFGHYEFTTMPFGLNASSSTFQRTMEIALRGLQWDVCLIYIDDVVVHSSTLEEHVQRLDIVLERIHNAGLKLNAEKCTMLQPEISMLGFVVNEDGVRPDPNNTAKVEQWTPPRNVKEVRRAVAFGSYYRRFIKDYARMVKPLVELTKKGKRFVWDQHCQQAFVDVKRA